MVIWTRYTRKAGVVGICVDWRRTVKSNMDEAIPLRRINGAYPVAIPLNLDRAYQKECLVIPDPFLLDSKTEKNKTAAGKQPSRKGAPSYLGTVPSLKHPAILYSHY